MAELRSTDGGLKCKLCLLRSFHIIRNNYTRHYGPRAAAISELNWDLVDWIYTSGNQTMDYRHIAAAVKRE